ncbi:24045_t:CDS:1, partial [Gigaspora margarita]
KSKKNPGSRPEGPVWNYFTKGEKVEKEGIKQPVIFVKNYGIMANQLN